MPDALRWQNTTFLAEVERHSGAAVSACYQCHKCSTGCPTAEEMDFSSSQLMRLIHLGQEDEVLGSRAIWLCASCETCSTRCPMDIDVAAVMDTLRILAVERAAATPGARGEKFNRSFLESVRRHGRVFEFGMMAAYKLRSGDLFSDVEKFPRLLAKGRLSLLPKRSGDAKRIREIFRRAEEEDKNQ